MLNHLDNGRLQSSRQFRNAIGHRQGFLREGYPCPEEGGWQALCDQVDEEEIYLEEEPGEEGDDGTGYSYEDRSSVPHQDSFSLSGREKDLPCSIVLSWRRIVRSSL